MKMIGKLVTLLLNIVFLQYMMVEPFPLFILQSLTYQGMLLLCVSSVVTYCFKESRFEAILRSVSYSMAVFISIISWILLIPVDEDGLWTIKNHFFHTLNTIYCIVCIYATPQQWRKRDWKYPLLYGILYVLYNILQQNKGHSAIYPFLDFVNNYYLAWLIVGLSAVLIPSCHLGLCSSNSKLWRN
ncbi:uncharacterized protein LOC111710314 [Eurytemora carolleeae]|uniref:uncharacterized protein LOC111710314 n=1 Tax=Eurytemora carolleeae TaxID=1294199 RepID=UPI000C792E91|nr:uncharacterized protein LOC111710314 [Eurytemora carolleeae]|eukprot:XP_023340144.1 uncharacterized protein LOC111710314 [Eurytemora affinis]